MIRDPSDGSVKPDPISTACTCEAVTDDYGAPQIRVCERCSRTIAASIGPPHPQQPASGLPMTSAKAAYLARLEVSREWLKSYRPRSIEEAKS